jgi:hypothetical protein
VHINDNLKTQTNNNKNAYLVFYIIFLLYTYFLCFSVLSPFFSGIMKYKFTIRMYKHNYTFIFWNRTKREKKQNLNTTADKSNQKFENITKRKQISFQQNSVCLCVRKIKLLPNYSQDKSKFVSYFIKQSICMISYFVLFVI